MKRRDFLKITGSTTVVIAASTIIGCSGDAANKPWHVAGSKYNDIRMRALSWAVLAPNPHNRQPWLVKMNDDLSITLSIDNDKLLPETDPFNRQILIGMGCFSELLRMAAAEDGYKLDFNWFPEGVIDENNVIDKRPIAKINFKKGANPDPLFKQVLKRRSYKEPFIDKDIPYNTLNELKTAKVGKIEIEINNEKQFIDKMRKLSQDAMDIELKTERTYMESVNLLRIGSDEVRANPDGIDLDGNVFMLLRMLGLFTREDAADMTSSGYKKNTDKILKTLKSTHGFMWIITNNNTRQDQIEAGRNYVRTNLKATEMNLSMHPVSQGLQEYVEMKEIHQKINQLIGIKEPRRVQMLTRIGYGEEIDASPRWPVEKIITNV